MRVCLIGPNVLTVICLVQNTTPTLRPILMFSLVRVEEEGALYGGGLYTQLYFSSSHCIL
jgi:hypothetical protein